MARPTVRLELSRSAILARRRQANHLDARLPGGVDSLQRAAWAGLTDSMPRAALLSLHARVEGVQPGSWEDPALVQLWGPRYSVYVVAARDVAVFTLGRLPDGARAIARAESAAQRLEAFLQGQRMGFERAGRAMGVAPNSLRYGAPTGRILLRWEGARQPDIWCVAAPEMDVRPARLELARRYLHLFGPGTAAGLAQWAGIGGREASSALADLESELVPARGPLSDGWILARDESEIRAAPSATPAPARLLPSGDAFYLLWGAERELLVKDPGRRAELWTSRVWPGAVLLNGEVAGVWRRAGGDLTITAWRRFSSREWAALEEETSALPLPGLNGPVRLHREGDG